MFLHIDIDSFFASAERTADPSLEGIPMAVGSRSNLEIFEKERIGVRLMDDNSGAFVAPVFYSQREKSFEEYFVDTIDGERKIRGIITSASYEARACGVKTAMPIAQALKLCPEMVIIPSHYPLYHTLSQKLYRYMLRNIPKIEQFSIDEFFGDVSGWVDDANITLFARKLQSEIRTEFGLPVSIGIARAKWIAKLATESAKPYGVYHVEDIHAYIEDIPIEAFPGIGKGFQHRLKEHYITTLGEVKRNRSLLYRWKKPGIQLYKRVTGTDGEGIAQRPARKSIGISRTFDAIYDAREVRRRIMIMARHIAHMVMEKEVNPTSYYLKINYAEGMKVKRTESVNRIFSEKLFKRKLIEIYNAISIRHAGAVKLSISVSNFSELQYKTLSLLSYSEDTDANRLSTEVRKLREKFGLDIIKTANEL